MSSGPPADASRTESPPSPVWFDTDGRIELRAAAAAGELVEFMDRRSFMIDQATNMDW